MDGLRYHDLDARSLVATDSVLSPTLPRRHDNRNAHEDCSDGRHLQKGFISRVLLVATGMLV